MHEQRSSQAGSAGERKPEGGARCRQKAMDLLARRPHFRRELESKLARRGFDDATVTATGDWLEERGYLDDRDAARRLVRGALERKGYGPRRMRAELSRRGVEEGIVTETLAEAWSRDETDRALEIARSRVAQRGFDRPKLARYLERKGYAPGAIRGALEKLAKEA